MTTVVHFDPEFTERSLCGEADQGLAFLTSTREMVSCAHCVEVAAETRLPAGGWQPTGYVNAYRLQPYQRADVFEALTVSDCWTNELNETARRTLSDACWLLVGFVGLVAMIVMAAAAGGLN